MTGTTFLFAPAHHPALRNAMTVRRELGVRTVFNALGPIANPARATHQLIGTYDDRIRPILAGALGRHLTLPRKKVTIAWNRVSRALIPLRPIALPAPSGKD